MSLTPEHQLLRDIYVDYCFDRERAFKYKSDIENILGPLETEKAQHMAEVLKDVFETRFSMLNMNANERVVAEAKLVRLHHKYQDLLEE